MWAGSHSKVSSHRCVPSHSSEQQFTVSSHVPDTSSKFSLVRFPCKRWNKALDTEGCLRAKPGRQRGRVRAAAAGRRAYLEVLLHHLDFPLVWALFQSPICIMEQDLYHLQEKQLCVRIKGYGYICSTLTCMVSTELCFIVVLETQLGFWWLYSLMLSDEGLVLIC